jgi:hypothetical protein
LKDVAREEVPDETTREAIEEESFSGYATAISDPRVLLCMQGVEERACDEIVRPDCKTELLNEGLGVKGVAHSWMAVGQGTGEQYRQ